MKKIIKNEEGFVEIIVFIVVAIILLLFIFLFPFAFTTVSTTDNGVRSDWGKISDDLTGEGIYFYNPIKTDIVRIDMRERKEMFVALVMLGITLAVNLAVGFMIGFAMAYALKSDRITV